MNLRNLIIVLAIVLAISATLFFQQEDTAPSITSSPPLIYEPVDLVSDEKIPKAEDHTSVDWASITDRLSHYGQGGFTKAEEDAFNELHVLPLNWVTQADCSNLIDCKMQWEYPPSSYQTVDKEQLEELANA